jgi:hypothetical protein
VLGRLYPPTYLPTLLSLSIGARLASSGRLSFVG